MADITKSKQEEEAFNAAKKKQRAQEIAEKVEQARKSQRRQEFLVRKRQDAKRSLDQQRNDSIREHHDKQAAYKREAARLKAEEQRDVRENHLQVQE